MRALGLDRPVSPADGRVEDAPRDEVLVAGALRGEEDAFAELLGRHESAVLRVLRLLGVPRADREDVAQDVFVRVFRFLDGYRAGRPFRAWIYRIAVNAAHDHRARLGRRGFECAAPEGLEQAADAGPGPVAAVELRDLRRRLELALAVLSERERAVFVLRELEGMTTLDVARALGIHRITVRRHLGRARRHLQEALPALPKAK